MDPLSIATACLTLLSAAGKTVGAITTFIRGCRDARADLTSISGELTQLQLVLELLKDDTAVSDDRVLPESLQNQILSIIRNCSAVLDSINTALEKHAGKAGAAKWVMFGKTEVAGLRMSLEAHRGSLSLVLELVSVSLSKAIKEDVTAVRADVHDIKQDTNHIPQIMAELTRLRAIVAAGGIPPDASGQSYMLEQYLDSLTSYAETVCNDVVWDSDDSLPSRRPSPRPSPRSSLEDLNRSNGPPGAQSQNPTQEIAAEPSNTDDSPSPHPEPAADAVAEPALEADRSAIDPTSAVAVISAHTADMSPLQSRETDVSSANTDQNATQLPSGPSLPLDQAPDTSTSLRPPESTSSQNSTDGNAALNIDTPKTRVPRPADFSRWLEPTKLAYRKPVQDIQAEEGGQAATEQKELEGATPARSKAEAGTTAASASGEYDPFNFVWVPAPPPSTGTAPISKVVIISNENNSAGEIVQLVTDSATDANAGRFVELWGENASRSDFEQPEAGAAAGGDMVLAEGDPRYPSSGRV